MTMTASRPADTRVFMSLEEYLRTSFDDADRDFVDGEVFERNMGELPHAQLQGALLQRLWASGVELHLQVMPEIRIQVSPTRFRVADVAVWLPGDIGSRIPTVPPFLVIEVLSAEDRLVRLQPKIQDYLRHGVAWIWVIDPDERRAMRYSPSDPGGSVVTELRTENPAIIVPLAELFSALDPPAAGRY
jgi:Uma2 family endonuclease